jgi:hypothetical protein
MRTYSIQSRQSGAVLLIMLVIMVVGIAAVLVSSLNSSGLKNARQNTNAAVLVQAKEALIGRAASDPNRPGSLPCPDTNDDGSGELLVGSECPSYVGRLPWKTLGIPDLRDGTGAPLWYALSRNFRDDNSNPINSETLGSLTISGNQAANNIAAIVFAPGAPLCTQSRASNAAVNQYLEAMTVVTATNATVANASNDCASTPYNDQHLAITAAQLIQPVEMRIAREVKACLDDYAATSTNSSTYPWANAPTNISFYYSQSGILFGRLPKHQTPDQKVLDMINSLNAFQAMVTKCANGTGSQSALKSLGTSLKSDANDVKDNQPTNPPIPSSATSPAKNAGEKAKDEDVTCSDIEDNPSGNAIQTNLNSTFSALNDLPASFPWTTSCTLNTAAYWPEWRNQVFYQIDNQFKPGGQKNSPSISINGVGTYRAVVVIARSPVGSLTRISNNPNTYLESANQHNNPNPITTFTSNSISDAGYESNNDLVLCLDGRQTCK